MAANVKFRETSEINLDFLPSKLRDRLMPFQKEGVDFAIRKDGRVLIADEMGLGKTLQALSVAYFYRDEWPLLIIVPSSLRYPWIEEVEKWFPEINPDDINLIQSGADIHDISHAQISVVTYGLLRIPSSRVLQEALLNQDFKVIIADESHSIKNRKAATTKYLVPLLQQAKHKLLLTGTPALARPEELFPQLDALSFCPKIFGTWYEYARKYCNAQWVRFGREKRWKTDGASNLTDLQYLLKTHVMIRRLKKDVLKQLPPKQRQKIPFHLKESAMKKDMENTWRELNLVMEDKRTSINQMLGGASYLDQKGISDAGSTFQVHALMSELYRKTAEVKIGPMKDYVKMLCDNAGLKFIVFGYHHVMMDAISEQLHEQNVKFIRIDGNTVQQDRPRLVHQFQVDPKTRVAVLSIKAAGVGLTLTSAKLVVFAELDWTPGTLEQCEDRAHRIGQSETVHVHYLVAKGTLDDMVWAALCRKTTVVTTTLNGQRQVLSMEKGNKGQIDVLSKADAWVPPKNTSKDQPNSFFQSSPLPSNQKSLLEYFGPNSKKKRKRKKDLSSLDDTGHIDMDDSGSDEIMKTPQSKRRKNKETPQRSTQHFDNKSKWEQEKKRCVIVLDSDCDEEDFHEDNKNKASKSTGNILERNQVKPRMSLCDEIEGENIKEIEVTKEKGAGTDIDLPDITRKKRKKRNGKEHLHEEECENGEEEDNKERMSPSQRMSEIDMNMTPLGRRKMAVIRNRDGEGHQVAPPQSDSSQEKAAEESGEEIPSEMWSCAMCTFFNHKVLPYCEMCNSPNNKKTRSLTRKGTQTGGKPKSNQIRNYLNSPKIGEDKLEIDTTPTRKGVNINSKELLREERNSAVIPDSLRRTSCQMTNFTNKCVKSPTQTHNKGTDGEEEKTHSKLNIRCADSHDSHNLVKSLRDEADVKNDDVKLADNVGRVGNKSRSAEDSAPSPGSSKNKDITNDPENGDQVKGFKKQQMLDPAREDVDCIAETDGETASFIDSQSDIESINSASYIDEEDESTIIESYTDDESGQGGTDIDSSYVREMSNIDNIPRKSFHIFSPFDNSKSVRNSNRSTHEISDSESETEDRGQHKTLNQEQKRSHDISGSDLDDGNPRDAGRQNVDTDIFEDDVEGDAEAKFIAMETEAAAKLFSSEYIEASQSGGECKWMCMECGEENDGGTEDCEGCLTSRPQQDAQSGGPVTREVDLDSVSVYSLFYYSCSKNTSRIYLYSQDQEPLNVNFLPLDVELDNYPALPDVLLHPDNLKVVKRFVREWKSLTATKQRVVIKSAAIFCSPLRVYEDLKTGRVPSTQRYTSKSDTAAAAVSKADNIGGSVRVLARPNITPKKGRGRKQSQTPDGTTKQTPGDPPTHKTSKKTSENDKNGHASVASYSSSSEASTSHQQLLTNRFPNNLHNDNTENASLEEVDWDNMKGIAQVVDGEGNPLCVQCHNRYESALLSKQTVKENPWTTRFCSMPCARAYWMKHSRSYSVQQVFEAEHGVCQICELDAHEFFLKVRTTRDLKKRAHMIQESRYKVMKAEIKDKMVKQPNKGLFWHVDHIVAVADGGGECDVDNLRTLCTVCHRTVTAQQNKDRAVERKAEKRRRAAANTGDISMFFQPT